MMKYKLQIKGKDGWKTVQINKELVFLLGYIQGIEDTIPSICPKFEWRILDNKNTLPVVSP